MPDQFFINIALLAVGVSIGALLGETSRQQHDRALFREYNQLHAVITAPGCGHLMYGAITQINYGDTIQSTISGRRVPKFSIDQENDTRKTALKSRPLAAPKNYIPWIRAKNMVG